jgi:Flp pilus assembly protein TadG
MNRQTVLDLWSDRRGAIAPLGAMMLVFVIGFAALALDMGHNYVVKNRLQATADATALAGVSQLPDEAAMVVKAQEYAEKNMSAAEYGTVLANADVIAGNWDIDTRTFTPALAPVNAVQTTTRQESTSGNAAPVFLGQILGFAGYDLTASTIATVGAGPDIEPTGCITALSPDAPEAFKMVGTADITLTACDLLVASSDPCALSAKGVTTITIDGSSGDGGVYYNDDGGFCVKGGGVVINPPPEPTAEKIRPSLRLHQRQIHRQRHHPARRLLRRHHMDRQRHGDLPKW